MICQASYDNHADIPEAHREEFHQVNGKWVLKDTAIPGVGALFNTALAANSERQLSQLATKKTRISELEGQLNAAQDKLAILDAPGSKVLSEGDTKQWEAYVKLGTPGDIEKQLGEALAVKDKVAQFEIAETMSKIATPESKINAAVLSDWATSKEGEGLTFFVKSVEQDNGKGVKAAVDVPFVRIETKAADGKITVSEKELLPFAKETLPGWKYDALTTVVADDGTKAKAAAPVKGVRVPDLGSATKPAAGDTAKERPVDRFNKQREEKPNPFMKPMIPGMPAVTAGVK